MTDLPNNQSDNHWRKKRRRSSSSQSRSRKRCGLRMHWFSRKLFFRLGFIAAACALAGWLLFFVVLRPKLQWSEEIFRGVYYSCLEIPTDYGSGKAMIAEIYWDEPGVELFFRKPRPSYSTKRHFTLLPADALLVQHDLSILMNSTRYLPGEWWKSYPLREVDSLETLVWDGEFTHLHKNSYMFGWDEAGEFHFEAQKPPRLEFLAKLKWGLGVQSISITNGEIRSAAINQNHFRDARTFLGIDPEKKKIWFMVFDKISEHGMNEMAQAAGVIVGGQLDASDASTMIIGSGAKGVFPFIGIRGRRPLGPIMGIRAEKISRD